MGDSYRPNDGYGRSHDRDYPRYNDCSNGYDRPRDYDDRRPQYDDRSYAPPPQRYPDHARASNHGPPQPPSRNAPPPRHELPRGPRGEGYTFKGAARGAPPRPENDFTFSAPNEKTLAAEQWGPAAAGKIHRQREGRPAPRREGRPAPRREVLPRNDNARGRGGYAARGRGGFRGGYVSKPAHGREILLDTHRETTPEQLEGMNSGQSRFKTASDLSDSDSEAMDTDSEDGASRQGPSKRTKTEDATANSVPKWSNPDPYTALPPPESLGAPKRDIVKEIRKAKVEAAARSETSNSVAKNDDFISFENFNDEPPAKKLNTGKQPTIRAGFAAFDDSERFHHNGPTTSTFTPVNGHQTRPQLSDVVDLTGPPDTVDLTGPPPPPPLGLEIPSSDEIAALTMTQTSRTIRAEKRKLRAPREKGDILEEWEVIDGQDATPWCKEDHSKTANTGFRLHKEICDFVDFMSPRDFEQAARLDLVRRVENACQSFNASSRSIVVHCFGSFASGLYLPTADMDLVAMSSDFTSSGTRTFCVSANQLRKLTFHMEKTGMAAPGTAAFIASAKVPLVKFVDRLTGIKVDISFENDSGFAALETFTRWKQDYPAMPAMVAVVKQILAMRGLNEVFSGGIGGFTTICLVINVLQHMPELQSGSMDATQHYGEVLMMFLDFFGNRFDYVRTGILMRAPFFYDKTKVHMARQNASRLTIIDPNRDDNDISGGSREIDIVLGCFRHAYSDLQRQIGAIDARKFGAVSILDSVLGGNYSQLLAQREKLDRLFSRPSSAGVSTLAPPPVLTAKASAAAAAAMKTKKPKKPKRAKKAKASPQKASGQTDQPPPPPKIQRANPIGTKQGKEPKLRPDLPPKSVLKRDTKKGRLEHRRAKRAWKVLKARPDIPVGKVPAMPTTGQSLALRAKYNKKKQKHDKQNKTQQPNTQQPIKQESIKQQPNTQATNKPGHRFSFRKSQPKTSK